MWGCIGEVVCVWVYIGDVWYITVAPPPLSQPPLQVPHSLTIHTEDSSDILRLLWQYYLRLVLWMVREVWRPRLYCDLGYMHEGC